MTSLSCTSAREQMLTAEPEELRVGSAAPLARHLQECAACDRAARAILAQQETLRDALATLTTTDGDPLPAQRGRRGRMWWQIPAGIAAAIALLFIGRDALQRDPSALPMPVRPVVVPRVPIVNATAGRAVAIMQTSNPNITVVWQVESAQ